MFIFSRNGNIEYDLGFPGIFASSSFYSAQHTRCPIEHEECGDQIQYEVGCCSGRPRPVDADDKQF